MKGRELLEEMRKAKDNIRQADRLEDFFKNNPDASQKLSEAAGLSVMASSLINSLSCCQEMRLQALEKALNDADIKV